MIMNLFATSGRRGCDRPDLTRDEQILAELQAPGLRLGPLLNFGKSE
jgi:hypothetical protein